MIKLICPLCKRGKLAPAKPARDDVRRYCLRCSEKTGLASGIWRILGDPRGEE